MTFADARSSSASATAFATRELKPRIGTEITADKEALLSREHAATIRDLLGERGVLVFPRIDFTNDEQVAFTETLGTLATEMRGEQVCNVTLDKTVNKGADYLKGSLYWHLDGTMNEVPILASLLSSKVLPSNGGGDTEFCNTYAAYHDLRDEDKQAYEPEPELRMPQQMMAIGERELPLVWKHRTGRKSLVLGCTAGHVGTMHRAKPYDPNSGRLLQRTKLAGEEPFV
jgi:alpha-ketoglutarate-dependent taurine dioxygenase